MSPVRRHRTSSGSEHLHEQLPRRCAIPRVTFTDCEVRVQRLVVVRENDRQIGRDGSFCRARVASGREAPAEDRARELLEVSHAGLGIASWQHHALVDAPGEQRLPLRILAVQNRSRLDQRRSRDHQSGWLDEAQPFEVGTGVRIGSGHASEGFGTDAEVFRVEQRSVFSREVTIGTRRVDFRWDRPPQDSQSLVADARHPCTAGARH